jgi:hypothetical protein
VDGNISGAPPLPGDYIARYHFEKERVRTTRALSDWVWNRASGSYDTWVYHNFDCPETGSDGSFRIQFISGPLGTTVPHHVRVNVNGVEYADTIWYSSTATDIFQLEFVCSNLYPSGNMLGIEFVLSTPGYDILYLDWFEIFTGTGYSQEPGQVEVPLEWLADTGRYRVDWNSGLSDCYVFQISGDRLASLIEFSGENSFEFDIPASWASRSRELWIADGNELLSPVSLEECSPGRIIEVLDGADVVYVYADLFSPDVAGLDRPGRERFLISAQEVYDEFNGGVRDPAAIRAMMDHFFLTWDPVPADLVLIGYGNWDPRRFMTSRISLLDILINPTTGTTSDDGFVILGGSNYPQAGVSRICTDSRYDVQLVVDRASAYSDGTSRGNWQAVMLAAADDEGLSGTETSHTIQTENIVNNHLPPRIRPVKLYEIFYDWNSQGKKPDARLDYIDAWSDGCIISLYMGHGGYDQLADEGLLYLEDMDMLVCDGRLPLALFGSCSVGEFQNPVMNCIASEITTTPFGGAILGFGASAGSSGSQNEVLMSAFLDYLFGADQLSMATCAILAKISNGYSSNDYMYILFGDGSLELAIPDSSGSYDSTPLLTGETATLSGVCANEGLVLIRAFESCRPDTYYTSISRPIPYLSMGNLFYRGVAPAMPGISTDVFVPIDADTGSLARVEFFFLGNYSESLSALYPINLGVGSPSSSDTSGPDIELWIDGFRHENHPVVSGEITVRAVLSDPSGINLLGNTGTQLTLYVDGTPTSVSEYFNYYPASSESGELSVNIGQLPEGERSLQLRAADGLLNLSIEELELTVLNQGVVFLNNVFVYPNPCSDSVTFNWLQTAPAAVEISIFTVSGREIAGFNGVTGEAGYNQYLWDCRDGDSDPVASGSYVYRISVRSWGSSDVQDDYTGIVAILR